MRSSGRPGRPRPPRTKSEKTSMTASRRLRSWSLSDRSSACMEPEMSTTIIMAMPCFFTRLARSGSRGPGAEGLLLAGAVGGELDAVAGGEELAEEAPVLGPEQRLRLAEELLGRQLRRADAVAVLDVATHDVRQVHVPVVGHGGRRHA